MTRLPTPTRSEKSRGWLRPGIIFGVVLLAFAIAFPYLVDRPKFWIPNIGIKSLWLGIVAMSLVFLNRYVGLLSLAQMTIAGMSAYGVAYATVTLGLPPWVSIVFGLMIGTIAGYLIALVTARTKAIYFLMLTLAIGQVFYSWAAQAVDVTNASRGLYPVPRPDLGVMNLADLNSFYYFALAAAVLCYLLCRYVATSSFGLALQGIRDSPERMSALGYNVNRYRVGAITFASFIASIGGVIVVFDRNQVDPSVVNLNATLDILIVAVIGGIGSLLGVFAGGVVLSLLLNFSQDFTDRYMTLTGLVFIAVLLFAPAGLAGIGKQVQGVKDRVLRKRNSAPVLEPEKEPPTEPSEENLTTEGTQR